MFGPPPLKWLTFGPNDSQHDHCESERRVHGACEEGEVLSWKKGVDYFVERSTFPHRVQAEPASRPGSNYTATPHSHILIAVVNLFQ